MNTHDCHLIQFEKKSHETGNLVFMESKKDIPFDIKRAYYIYDVPSYAKRGSHAHKNLKQVLIALSGSLEIIVDNGYAKKKYLLDNPHQGLYLGSNLWRDLVSFSPGAICLVFAAEYYDPSDYIRNYTEFLNFIRSQNDYSVLKS